MATTTKRPARKVTPISSKSWKAKVKQNVLQRLRSRHHSSLQTLLHDELQRRDIVLDCTNDTNDGYCTISEEELLELQEEIERDRERERSLLADELLEWEIAEDLYWQDQLDEYERQQQTDDIEQDKVLCPICHDNYLMNGIWCPGRMDESCTLHVPSASSMTLWDLNDRLGTIFENHQGCSGDLNFYMDNQHLHVTCYTCETSLCVI